MLAVNFVHANIKEHTYHERNTNMCIPKQNPASYERQTHCHCVKIYNKASSKYQEIRQTKFKNPD